MFRLRLWSSDLEKILNKEFPGIAPINGLKIAQSESGGTLTLTFDTPALPPVESGEVQDISDALYEVSMRGRQ